MMKSLTFKQIAGLAVCAGLMVTAPGYAHGPGHDTAKGSTMHGHGMGRGSGQRRGMMGQGAHGMGDGHGAMGYGGGMMGGGFGMGMGHGMMGDGMGMMRGMGPKMMGPFAGQALDLTKEQRTKFVAIQRDIAQKRWLLMGEMQQQRFDQQEAFIAGKENEIAARESFEANTQLRREMFELSLEARKRFNAVLTDEQRKSLRPS